jgi:cytochrome c-type biogenesis protein CcmH/NrfF
VLLGFGIMMLIRTIRQRRQLQDSPFSAEEQERLRQLLGNNPREQEDRQ